MSSHSSQESTPAASGALRPTTPCPDVAAARAVMLQAVGDIEAIQKQLSDICERLPAPQNETFHHAAELRGYMECIFRETLEDARDTLLEAALKEEATLRRETLQRLRWQLEPQILRGGLP